MKQTRILLVDDNASIHEDFKHILTSSTELWQTEDGLAELEKELFGNKPQSPVGMRYLIDDAYQGEEAVMLAREAAEEGLPYSLIFMDVRMPPGMDGIRTAERIWANYPLTEIVICTAFSDYTWDEILGTLGKTDRLLFMKKPFDTITVQQTVLALSRKWEQRSSVQRYIEDLQVELDERSSQIHTLEERLARMTHSQGNRMLAKSEFLSSIHYSIRSPLNGIMGMADLLMDTELSTEQRNCTRALKESADSLLALATDSMLCTRHDVENMQTQILEFDIRTMMENTAEFAALFSRRRPLRSATIVHPAVPETVRADPGWLRQILLLLCNYLLRGKELYCLTLRLSLLEPGAGQEDAPADGQAVGMLFEIGGETEAAGTAPGRDGAAGPVGRAEKEAFMRKAAEIPGLALAGEIARNMGMTLGMETGEDTRCRFGMAAGIMPCDGRGSILFDRETLKGSRILIVGTSRVSRRIIALHIEHWGGEIVEASDVPAAIELAQSSLDTVKSFDTAIVDLDTAGIDDYVFVARQFMQYENLRSLPLICLAARTCRGDSGKAEEAGYRAFLTKPLKQPHLFHSISLLRQIRRGDLSWEQCGFLTRHRLDEIVNSLRFRFLVIQNTATQVDLVSLLESRGIRCDLSLFADEWPADRGGKHYDAVVLDARGHDRTALAFVDVHRDVLSALPVIVRTGSASVWDEPSRDYPFLAVTASAGEQALIDKVRGAVAAGTEITR